MKPTIVVLRPLGPGTIERPPLSSSVTVYLGSPTLWARAHFRSKDDAPKMTDLYRKTRMST